MELVEGRVEIGDEQFPDVGTFVDSLDAVGDAHGVTVQAFDARYVVSRRHLERAVELADRERGRGDAIARDRGVEILLYAAGRRQIDRALELGVGEGETPAVILIDDGGDDADVADHNDNDVDVADHNDNDVGDDEDNRNDGDRNDGDRNPVVTPQETAAAAEVRELVAEDGTLGDYDEGQVREFYGVGDRELSATTAGLEALVLERVALLVVDR
jgi:KEOPS complex subunit Cgi121